MPRNLSSGQSSLSNAVDVPDTSFLTTEMIDWARAASAESPIVYVETEYHGGTGAQAAIIWRYGKVLLGPIITVTEDNKPPTPLADHAINRCLRQIGVSRGSALDEFDALGLGRHRSNEDWIAAKAMQE